jgi:signal transduction histidine kinase
MERSDGRPASDRPLRPGSRAAGGGRVIATREIALVTGLLVATLVVAATSFPFAVAAPQLDIALMAVGTTVLVEVAALSYLRFRYGGEGLLEAAGFLVLAIANLLNLIAVITHADSALGMTLDAPGQLPLYFWAAARLLAASLIAAGAVRGRVHSTGRGWTAALLWGPTALLGLACAALWLVRDSVPVLVDPATLAALAEEATRPAPLPGVNPGILLLDGSAAVLLVVAAVAYARTGRGAAGIPRSYMVPALLLGTFSQVQFILYPAVYTGLVSTGDVLRLAAYVVLAVGVIAGARRDLAALRSANGRLRLMALAEADRTAIAERARLARELHDGLAQDIWTAKLELDRLGSELSAADRGAGGQFDRVRVAVEAAQGEAQAAVQALRSGFDAGTDLQDELPRHVDAFAERTGFSVTLELDAQVDLQGVAAAEALRVVEEALHNAEKHADATAVRVRAVATSEGVDIAVEDNGHGFDPGEPTAGHGLLGMRERAALLGGELSIRSAPGDGTRVELLLPAAGPPP